MIGRLRDMARSRDGKAWIVTFSTPENFSEAFDEMSGKDVSIDIKPAHRKRSLDANAYAWVLIDKIAEKTGLKKTEVYRNAIREIGGVSATVCVQDRAVESLRYGWSKNGIGWQSETMKSKIPGCTNVVLYYGSSAYDSRQMAQFIDSLIQDAESLGIPTITDEQADRLVGKWGKRDKVDHAG